MKMFKTLIYYILPVLLLPYHPGSGQDNAFPPNPVVPSARQIAYQQLEVIGFIHFGVNTFTDREWGTGKEEPAIFNPVRLDAGQWAGTAREAGMGMLILTAKHHDGFCLWPSAYTEHSVKNSPWKEGNGDVVRELSEACQENGLNMGLYLSPWDMHEPKYGTSQYNDYYLSQLKELLTQYGTVSEVWMDGAKGKNAKDMEYDFGAYHAMIYRLQPEALIFSDVGPDIRWIGNEHGIAGETNWSMITTEGMSIGDADTGYLNSGDPKGKEWIVGECDVSIRPGWFYHPSQDKQVKTPRQLVDLYYKSVGRNGTLLLNLPPDPRGLIHENDVMALKAFRNILDETFRNNLAKDSKTDASSRWDRSGAYDPTMALDENPETFWAAAKDDKQPVLTIHFEDIQTFDRLMLQEPIRYGQRISSFSVEAWKGDRWLQVAEGTTIGYKRLLRILPVSTGKIRILISGYNNTPALSNVGCYQSSPLETTDPE